MLCGIGEGNGRIVVRIVVREDDGVGEDVFVEDVMWDWRRRW